MSDERLIELALGSEAATAEESVAMAMTLLNWHKRPKDEKTEDIVDASPFFRHRVSEVGL